jgi:hypothetical protein
MIMQTPESSGQVAIYSNGRTAEIVVNSFSPVSGLGSFNRYAAHRCGQSFCPDPRIRGIYRWPVYAFLPLVLVILP